MPCRSLVQTFPAQVHCCDWAAGIDADKGPAARWFSKHADDVVVFQDYLGRMCARDPRTCGPSKSRRTVRPSHDDPSPGDHAIILSSGQSAC